MARTRRSVDERVAELDVKIQKKQAEIAKLEDQKNSLLHPVSMKAVITRAKEAGLTPAAMAKKLGLEL